MPELSHFDEKGNSRMVDVGDKAVSRRIAIASGGVKLQPNTLARITRREMKKGDVLEVARLAGIMAAKKTSDLIPLCHPIRLDSVQLEFSFPNDSSIRIEATVCASDRTGVEMESLTAVMAAGLTIYDMCKSIDRGMQLTDVHLVEKTGGKSGDYRRTE